MTRRRDGPDELRESARQMVMLAAWQDTERYIRSRIDDNMKRLLTCHKDEIDVHRANVRTLESILNHVNRLQNPVEYM